MASAADAEAICPSELELRHEDEADAAGVVPVEMDGVLPWTRLLARIKPHYPSTGPRGGCAPKPLETMLRVFPLQTWYSLSDPVVL